MLIGHHTHTAGINSVSIGVRTGGVCSRRRQWAQLTWHDEALHFCILFRLNFPHKNVFNNPATLMYKDLYCGHSSSCVTIILTDYLKGTFVVIIWVFTNLLSSITHVLSSFYLTVAD